MFRFRKVSKKCHVLFDWPLMEIVRMSLPISEDNPSDFSGSPSSCYFAKNTFD